MARVKVLVDMKLNEKELMKALTEKGQEVIEEIVEDLKKVSSDLAPHKKGVLDTTAITYYENNHNGRIQGSVSFSAIGKEGYDYAISMHEWHYNLGKGSVEKARKVKPKSKFGTISHPLGRKYLEAPALQLHKPWGVYILTELGKVINSGGKK